jgi:hypothetical protein
MLIVLNLKPCEIIFFGLNISIGRAVNVTKPFNLINYPFKTIKELPPVLPGAGYTLEKRHRPLGLPSVKILPKLCMAKSA